MAQSDTRAPRPIEPDPAYPPLHVILGYLLGTWADLHVVQSGRDTRKGKSADHVR